MANSTPGYIDGRRTRVGNVPLWGPVPNVLIPGSWEAYGIFEDFIGVEDMAAANSMRLPSGAWEFLEATNGTIAQADEAGGAAVIAAVAADNNGAQITLGSLTSGGAFIPAANKHIWFEAKAKVYIETAGQFNHFIGLINPVNADILENNGVVPLTNPDIIGFLTYDGQTNWYSIGDDGGNQVRADLSCAVDDQWHYFGFYVDGITGVTIYYDRAVVAAGAIAADQLPDGIGLMPAFAVKAGNAAGLDSLTIDYVMCVQLR